MKQMTLGEAQMKIIEKNTHAGSCQIGSCQNSKIIDEKCPKCGTSIGCLNFCDAIPSDYYYYSFHICMNPDCGRVESKWEKEGNLGGGPCVDITWCLICDRKL